MFWEVTPVSSKSKGIMVVSFTLQFTVRFCAAVKNKVTRSAPCDRADLVVKLKMVEIRRPAAVSVTQKAHECICSLPAFPLTSMSDNNTPPEKHSFLGKFNLVITYWTYTLSNARQAVKQIQRRMTLTVKWERWARVEMPLIGHAYVNVPLYPGQGDSFRAIPPTLPLDVHYYTQATFW